MDCTVGQNSSPLLYKNWNISAISSYYSHSTLEAFAQRVMFLEPNLSHLFKYVAG